MTAEALKIAVAAGRRTTFAMRAAHFAKGNVLFVFGAGLLVAIVLGAIFAPLIAPYDPTAMNFLDKLQGPSLNHLMGTNELGPGHLLAGPVWRSHARFWSGWWLCPWPS